LAKALTLEIHTKTTCARIGAANNTSNETMNANNTCAHPRKVRKANEEIMDSKNDHKQKHQHLAQSGDTLAKSGT
jgi:hypothetical protein